MTHLELLGFVRSDDFDNIFVSKIIIYEKEHQTSLLGDVFDVQGIHAVEDIIGVLKTKTSLYNIKSLLHDDPLNLCIPFHRHLISRCYSKYGIDNTRILISRHYHSNPIFATLPLEDGSSILQYEDAHMSGYVPSGRASRGAVTQRRV